MAAYAEGTTTDAQSSRNEIEKMILKFGGDNILLGSIQDSAIVQFRARDRYIRISLPNVQRNDRRVAKSPTGQARSAKAIDSAVAAETRRRWRCLVLLVKAKFTAINDGIVQFEDEFLSDTVMANGQTVREQIQPQIAAGYASGDMGQLRIGFNG